MKVSLWRDIYKYAKAKGTVPLDERQMDTLKNLYLELAKALIMGFMVFSTLYGYMDLRGLESTFSYLELSCSLLGALTYYYMLRFCYQDVIGIDSNFEMLLVPAIIFTPCLLMEGGLLIISFFDIPVPSDIYVFTSLPIFLVLTYQGANLVYRKGKAQQEQDSYQGELHFRSRKQIVNYIIITLVLIALFPIPYDTVLNLLLLCACILVISTVCYYGLYTPHNEYILNESGVIYHRALWGKKGGFLPYSEIRDIQQQDTFNVGYSKDKVCIYMKNGEEIRLYPENAYQFCVEVKNNLM